MNPFPKDFELIQFFEAEPQVLDKGVPWFYNRLTFATKRGDDLVTCTIEPASKSLKIIWERNGKEVVNFSTAHVGGIELKMEDGIELLRASLSGADFLKPLELQLKPFIRMTCGTELR